MWRGRGALARQRQQQRSAAPRASHLRPWRSYSNGKKPAAPPPAAGDAKAAAKDAPPPISEEEAFGHGVFARPPPFAEMFSSGATYATAGSFDEYVKLGKRLAVVFGPWAQLREGQPSVGAWRIQQKEVWEDNRYWQQLGTLGDLHRVPLSELPYDTHLREELDYLIAYNLKLDIYRLKQYAPIKALGARHWTRFNAPGHWKADNLLDHLVAGPLRFVQAKWWTAFPSFSLLGSRRRVTMRLAFRTPNGEVLEEVPFNGTLRGVGPQPELSWRIQRGVLLPHPKEEDAIEMEKIPRAIHHDGGYDFALGWLHFGWLRMRAFPSRYMFYWGVNFPLPSLGVQAVEPGQLVRDKEEMPFGWDRAVALRAHEDALMHEAFPITAFTVGTAANAPIRKFLSDEQELLLKTWLQRYQDRKKAEAERAARIAEQAKGDSAVLAEQVKAEAARKEAAARTREAEAQFAAIVNKVLPDLTPDPEIAKKVDEKEKAAAAAKLEPANWAPFDRMDASLLATLAVERKFKDYYLNRMAERFDLWFDYEDDWALDDDSLEYMRFQRASWRGGPGPLNVRLLEIDKHESKRIKAGVASSTLGDEFPAEALNRPEWAKWYSNERRYQDFYNAWWYNCVWEAREMWQRRRDLLSRYQRLPKWLSEKEEEQQKADWQAQYEADRRAFVESFQPEDLKDYQFRDEAMQEFYLKYMEEKGKDAREPPEEEGMAATDEEQLSPREKIMRTRRRPKPPPKREEGGEF